MRLALCAAVSAFVFAAPALAQNSPWAVGITIGADTPVNGKVHGAATAPNSTFNGSNGTLRIRERSYKDLYETGLTGTVEVRYRMSEVSEFFGAVSYTQADGKRAQVGDFTCCTNAVTPVTAQFGDYRSIGLEVGYRQYFYTFLEGFQPYFAVRGGVTRTDEIKANFQIGATALNNVPFYDETYAMMIGGDLGLLYQISPNAQLGGEVGVRYTTKLKDNDSVLRTALPSLVGINDEGDRLSVPVSFRLNAAF
jgi:hypothetical protein